MKALSILIGIAAGIGLALVIFKYSNRNHKMETQYDERQKDVRGKGYRYAYYAMMIYEAILLILSIGEVALPVESYVLHFTGMLVGAMVLATYCIWHDAYWGLNNNRKRCGLIFLALGILNAIPVIGSLARGGMLENGKLATPAINLGVLIMLVVTGAELLIKAQLEKRGAEE